jgi:ABC-2 type transport system ATP-binding protein
VSVVAGSAAGTRPGAGQLYAEAHGVVKRYGGRAVLDGVSVELRQGELVVLLGPNGAGKTTLVGIMTGLRRPDAGEVRLFGEDPRRPLARRTIGVTPQQIAFPKALRAREVLDLVRGHALRPEPMDRLAERFQLAAILDRQTGGLSGGEMRQLALAAAFAGRPQLVFLDEPTTGLDVAMRRRVWATIRDDVAGGTTMLLTTHYLEEAEALADRIVVLSRGRVVEASDVPTIRRRLSLTRVRFRAPAPPRLPGVDVAAAADGWYTVETGDGDAVVRQLVASGCAFRDLEVRPLGLEDAVLRILERP